MEGALIPGYLQEKGNLSQPTFDHDLKIGNVHVDQESIFKGQGKGAGVTKLLEADKWHDQNWIL